MDREDIFEITDFTVVTDLERFVVSIETLLYEWQLGGKRGPKYFAKGQLQRANWVDRSEKVIFGEKSFRFTHYYINESEMNIDPDDQLNHLPSAAADLLSTTAGDFSEGSPIVAEFFGSELSSGILTVFPLFHLLPGLTEFLLLFPNSLADCVQGEDGRNVLLSAINMACVDADCQLPVFLHHDQPDRHLYFGSCQNANARVEFSSVHLRYCRPNHRHLTGLLDLFQEKVHCPVQSPSPTKVSVCLDYVVHADVDVDWSQRNDHFDDDSQLVDSPLTGLASHLQIGAMQDPLEYMGTIEQQCKGRHPNGHRRHSELRVSMTWPNLNEDMLVENDVYSDLDPLNAPYWAAKVVFKTGLQCLMHLVVRLQILLNRQSSRSSFDISLSYSVRLSWTGSNVPNMARIRRHSQRSLGTVPIDARVNLDGTQRQTAPCPSSWSECDTAGPDLRSCLLSQKLDLLNACIQLKHRRHCQLEQLVLDGELFYDAVENADDLDDCQPRGRLETFNKMMLLNSPTQPLFIPVTQDPTPMTEDMLEEQAAYWSTLEDNGQHLNILAKTQLDTLKSDMQAFKAANPGCIMADFIRWHSPRDWLEDEGRLSERMSMPDNIWLETWQSSKPIPVHLQKRLFNESKEAEKILYWLGGLTVSEMIQLILPPLFVSAFTQLVENACDVHDLIADNLNKLCHKLSYATKHGSIDDYRDLLHDVHWVESTIAQYESLKSRLSSNVVGTSDRESDRNEPKLNENDLKLFVMSLMQRKGRGSVPIFGAANGALGLAMRKLLHFKVGKDGTLPVPRRKQYILRSFVPRPEIHSRSCPQRLYACIDEEKEFRLHGAFSQDITFF